MEDHNRKLLIDIYARLESERDRHSAINQLNAIARSYNRPVEANNR